MTLNDMRDVADRRVFVSARIAVALCLVLVIHGDFNIYVYRTWGAVIDGSPSPVWRVIISALLSVTYAFAYYVVDRFLIGDKKL